MKAHELNPIPESTPKTITMENCIRAEMQRSLQPVTNKQVMKDVARLPSLVVHQASEHGQMPHALTSDQRKDEDTVLLHLDLLKVSETLKQHAFKQLSNSYGQAYMGVALFKIMQGGWTVGTTPHEYLSLQLMGKDGRAYLLVIKDVSVVRRMNEQTGEEERIGSEVKDAPPIAKVVTISEMREEHDSPEIVDELLFTEVYVMDKNFLACFDPLDPCIVPASHLTSADIQETVERWFIQGQWMGEQGALAWKARKQRAEGERNAWEILNAIESHIMKKWQVGQIGLFQPSLPRHVQQMLRAIKTMQMEPRMYHAKLAEVWGIADVAKEIRSIFNFRHKSTQEFYETVSEITDVALSPQSRRL